MSETTTTIEEAMKPALADDNDTPAGFLEISASISAASSISQYHSALNSPASSCETPNLLGVEEEKCLISFASGDLQMPSSPPRSTPSITPTSPEFSSNRYKDPFESPQKPRSISQGADDSGKTPNVYINGLPPYFREEQLFALAAPFGDVVSVRCFTRHTTKATSGYGFVLFKTLAAAERCIAGLKRSDLHPSLSKANKQPRVVCSPTSPALPTRHSTTVSGTSDPHSIAAGDAELSFKAKMAQLEDKHSTNLYIEGLPGSADKNTLIELVYPHAIHSSRFLRSKVPDSGTMIAFMRMNTRAAAEEIIARLNGKKVRGWDGAESRIYVRFADTLDQRELRRSETSFLDGDDERLSIAQATLITYHGMEQLQSSSSSSLTAQPPSPPLYQSGPDTPQQQAQLPLPLAARVHEMLAFNPSAQIPPPPRPHPIIHNHNNLPGAGMGPHQTLPRPPVGSIHDLLAFNSAQTARAPPPHFAPRPPSHDPLYAPYAGPPPVPLPVNALHPNVAALFDSFAGAQGHRLQQAPAAAAAYPLPTMAMPSQFTSNSQFIANRQFNTNNQFSGNSQFNGNGQFRANNQFNHSNVNLNINSAGPKLNLNLHANGGPIPRLPMEGLPDQAPPQPHIDLETLRAGRLQPKVGPSTGSNLNPAPRMPQSNPRNTRPPAGLPPRPTAPLVKPAPGPLARPAVAFAQKPPEHHIMCIPLGVQPPLPPPPPSTATPPHPPTSTQTAAKVIQTAPKPVATAVKPIPPPPAKPSTSNGALASRDPFLRPLDISLHPAKNEVNSDTSPRLLFAATHARAATAPVEPRRHHKGLSTILEVPDADVDEDADADRDMEAGADTKPNPTQPPASFASVSSAPEASSSLKPDAFPSLSPTRGAFTSLTFASPVPGTINTKSPAPTLTRTLPGPPNVVLPLLRFA
ncbi:hypothetical protein C8R43DRAFT_1107407 [Mycena crocata]|nr:hypothetical protein C8R43DRAFT_1107407 [Mycena crocata]